jgi:hypothetical protein
MSFKPLSRDSDNNILLPTKSKRSQSALEYMMTYGWAILIIVIVAVILYSMGIFNPSSSVTFTSSGFSPFTISSVICSQDGLSFSVLAGPMPNGAYSMSVNSFYIVSSSGTNTSRISYTLSSPITLTSGKTGVIAVPNVVCPSAGTKVSMSANLEYSYSTTAGKVVTNTTGTLAGTATHGPTLPAGIEYYSQLTVSNSQSTATPSPFQQMVNFTSSDPGWTSISTSNFGQNVEFFYYNGSIIPSWLENYTSSHALWWLKIAAIPAGSSETVYVGFAPSTTNLFNTVNDGEAPQIPCGSTPTSSCSNYAEYDDGANVFNNYWNFAGTSFPVGFTNYNDGGTSTVDNGLNISLASSGYYYAFVYNTPISPDSIIETYSAGKRTAGPTDVGLYTGSSGSSAGYAGVADTWGWGYGGIDYGYANIGNPFDISYGSGVASIYWIGTGDEGVGWNYNFVTSTNPSVTISSSVYLSIGMGNSCPGSDLIYYWLRTRAYPPNGVMPSVNFGSAA